MCGPSKIAAKFIAFISKLALLNAALPYSPNLLDIPFILVDWNFLYSYTAFHIKLPFLVLDYTASAKCRIGISHHSMDNQAPKKEHLMKSGIICICTILSLLS
jgi:hypothetical protein